MKADRNVLRLAAVQQLRTYGIKVKNWNRINGNNRAQGRDHSRDKTIICNAVFGTPLHVLPQSTVVEHAVIPQFLVDACNYLEKHNHTEGLFRKSGSVIRLKALKAKVDQGEKCITMAPPCDVAGLVKQFFRELPEPVLPKELHEAFFKAQQLQNDESISATILLSCLLPERTADTLRYFLTFLNNVSLRSEENKMDASNLAVVFAPNLFHSGEGNEKSTAITERRLQLQAATVHKLIENCEQIGRVPEFVLEKVPGMIGVYGESTTPSLEHLEDVDGSTIEGCKRRRRRSVGDIVSGALSKLKANRTPSATPQLDLSATSSGTPIMTTPTWKRKILADSSQSLGFSNKKRRSIRHNIALELLPSSFLSQNSTPSSDDIKKDDGSPPVSLESLQGPLSLSAGSVMLQSITSINRRKSKRLENKVERMESGKASCFSPKLSRKRMVRKSLRLRFSLGKNKDSNTLSSRGPAPNGSENIGWRLANQCDVHDYRWFSAEDLPSTPVVKHRDTREIERAFSESGSDQGSFAEDHKPSTVENLCNNDLLLQQTETVAVPQKPDSTYEDASDSKCSCPELPAKLVSEIKLQNLKIDSSSTDMNMTFSTSSNLNCINILDQQDTCETAVLKEKSTCFPSLGDHSRLNETQPLFKSSAVFSFTGQSSPDKMPLNYEVLKEQVENGISAESLTVPHSTDALVDSNHPSELHQSLRLPNELEPTLTKSGSNLLSTDGTPALEFPSKRLTLDAPLRKVSEQVLKTSECGHRKVIEHIQWFNSLSLNDQTPKCKTVQPPLSFKRTPVRHSIRRMNSLLYGNDKSIVTRTRSCKTTVGSPLVKSVSHESVLPFNSNSSSFVQNANVKQSKQSDVRQNNLSVEGFCKTKAARQTQYSVVFKQNRSANQQKNSFDRSINQSVFGDLTNGNMSRMHQVEGVLPKRSVVIENMSCVTPEKSICNSMLHKVSEKERHRYRGSPKCPISSGKLTTKPIDL
ncbi:rho GTPase-activating protein 11A-like [Chiloscyllium plagiosum]|uniref:rho GTPase-activating protein 11A-like n=1 Tax=Chiloscyllium plagiosum TaxID=36176 RepID=UPI001CB87F11|nr:rho GTPase-activating protein 11A-like [Chiloscyllium plagiosum]